MENVDLIAEKIANEAIKIATSGKKLPDELDRKSTRLNSSHSN